MQSIKWNRFKWFLDRLLDFKKKSYPLSSIGAKLIILGSPLAYVSITLLLPPKMVISGVEITNNQMDILSFILTLIPMAVGIFLIHHEIKNQARNTARVIITGLPGLSNSFPSNILSKSEHRLSREPVELSAPDEDIHNLIKRYNAEICVDLFKRFVLHESCEKLYIGGLARIPFLVSYGAFLRNAKGIIYFDKMHRDLNWRLLDDEDRDIQIAPYNSLPEPNSNGDVGLAIAFSTLIDAQQLPEYLRGHTVILTSNTNSERNLIVNQSNLHRVSESIGKIIDQLSINPKTKLVHLFLSVQSSLAIEIGRRYQEGIQKNWVIHNFKGDEHRYDWAVKLSSSCLTFYADNATAS